LANGLKYADALINPGFDLEIEVQAIGVGSFKVTLKNKYNSISNIFSASNIKTIILALFSAFLYELIRPEKEIKVIVNSDAYIIEHGDERIILPKEAQEYYDSLKRNENVKKEISNTFRILDKDGRVDYLKIAPNDRKENHIVINRPDFKHLALLSEPELETKEREERTRLIIIRAILEKSNRRWQFIWNGIKISAPILDDEFYDDFSNHKIKIAPGDSLEVDLKVIMKRDEDTNLYLNSEYHVLRVYNHISIDRDFGGQQNF
jgi:hypothetical protein